MLNSSAVSLGNANDVARRVDAALIALIAGSPLCHNQNCSAAIIWHMVVRNGDWRKVTQNEVFKLLAPDPRVAVLPLALGLSIEEDSADHRKLRELCDSLVGENYFPPEHLAFMYMSALLVGYTIQRSYRTAEITDTREWLGRTVRDFYPELDPVVVGGELQKFEPFLENPDDFVCLEDPFLTTVHNTLVAIHTLVIPNEWKNRGDFQSAVRIADRFYGVCCSCRVRHCS